MDCPNLYAGFLVLGVDALNEGGQLVAITPRSFANGPYFEQFRKLFLKTIAVDRIHTFESRSTVFSDTGVLQENLILAGTRGGQRSTVLCTASSGHLDEARTHVIPYSDLVRPDDRHEFLRVTTGESDTLATEVVADMPADLSDLDVSVSTGRVVDFRSRQSLRETADDGCVPLIYPGNLRDGIVLWPRPIHKAQGFAVRCETDRKLLVPAGCYVLVKRFSAKEERRRIVAAIWDPEENGSLPIALENHLNFFHHQGNGLVRELALGLCWWLNSTVVDKFFRTFSGHTQVNATDLRALRYPSIETLTKIGKAVPRMLPDQAEIDRLVSAAIRSERAG